MDITILQLYIIMAAYEYNMYIILLLYYSYCTQRYYGCLQRFGYSKRRVYVTHYYMLYFYTQLMYRRTVEKERRFVYTMTYLLKCHGINGLYFGRDGFSYFSARADARTHIITHSCGQYLL